MAFLLVQIILYIKEYKYVLRKFWLERYLSNKKYKKIKYVKGLKGIRKNYYNFIDNVGEKHILAQKFDKQM